MIRKKTFIVNIFKLGVIKWEIFYKKSQTWLRLKTKKIICKLRILNGCEKKKTDIIIIKIIF